MSGRVRLRPHRRNRKITMEKREKLVGRNLKETDYEKDFFRLSRDSGICSHLYT
jgi:hypothetical protein